LAAKACEARLVRKDLAGQGVAASAQSQQLSKPNVILVVMDDWDMAIAYGAPAIDTPTAIGSRAKA
jgi:hypothetical protein